MKKLFSNMKKAVRGWYSDKELVVLSGKETLVLILMLSFAFVIITVLSDENQRQEAEWRRRKNQQVQEIWETNKELSEIYRKQEQKEKNSIRRERND